MSSAILSVILEGKNKTSQAVNEAKGGLEGLRTAVGNFGRDAMGLGLKVSAGITTPLALMGLKAVSAASDLQESMSKVGIVFGENAAQVTAWSTTATTAFGMTQQQALESAGTFGNLFSAMGIGQDASTDMSMGLVQLASDLASFNNIDPTEALEKLRAGLVGEAEPLRTLGVNLTAAATEARAMAMGLAASTDELTPAMLAQARYALIMEQTALAQGDFARTSEGLANQTRIVKAQLGDLAAQIGTALLPFVTQAVQFIGGLVTKFREMDAPVRNAILVIAGLAAAAGPVVMVLGAVATGLGVLLSPIGLVIAGVALLAAAVVKNVGGVRDALQPVIDGVMLFFQVISWGVQDGWNAADWIDAFSSKFPVLGSVIGGVIGVLMNLPQTIRTMVGEWSTQLTMLRLVVETAFQGVADVVRTIIGIIVSSVQDHATQIRSQFEQAYNTVRTTVQQVLAQVQNIITTVLGVIRTFLARHGDDIQQTLGNAWESIARIINLAAQLVQATVVPIFQAIANFLRDHGEAIQTVLSGAWMVIKNLIEGVLTLIEGIITAVLQAIHGDWEGAWETIKDTVSEVWDNILGIIEGILTQLLGIYKLGIDELVDKVVKWMEDTLAKVKKGWEDVKKKTAEKLAELRQTIEDKFNAILDWLKGLPGEMMAIGASMMQGMIDGVKSMAGALLDAARGVINDAIAAAKALLGIKSPSRVFASMGMDMMAGMAQGLAEAAALVVDALQEIMGKVKLEALQGVADFVQASESILSALASMVAAVQTLATAALPAGDIGATVDALVVMMQVAISKMQAAAKMFKLDGVQAAAELAQAGGEIVSQLKSMVDGFTAVAGYTSPVIGPALNALFDQLHGVIFKLSKLLGLFKSDGLTAAVELAQAGVAITGQLKNMVDGFTAVAGYVPAVIGPTLNVLFDQMRGLIYKMSQISLLMDADGLPAAVALAQATGAITAQLKSMVDGFAAVAGYAAPVIGPALNSLFSDLWLVMIELATLASSSELGDTEAMAVLAGRIQQLVGFLQPAITALKALAEYASAVDFAEPISRLMADLAVVAQGIVFGLRGMGRDVLAGLEEAAPATEQLGRLVAFVRGAVDALNALAGYGRAARGSLATQTALFMADVAEAARQIVFGLRAMGRDVLASVEEMAPTAELIGRLVSFVRGAVDAIAALMDYVAGARGLPAKVQAFVVDILVVARALQTGLGSLTEELTAAYEGAIEFGERIGRLVGVVQPGIDAIRALTDYQGALGLPAAVRAFVTDVLALAHELRVGLGSLSAPLTTAYDGAIEFAERIGRIVAVVRPGIDAIAAVTGYQAAENLPAAVRAFGRDVVAMASELRLAFGSLSEPLTAAFDGAIEFADRIARIVSVVQPGIAAITAVLGYKAAQGLAGKVRAFAADVLQVAEELRIGLGTPSEEMLAAYDAAATWATKITGILALIQPAMAALQELSRYGGGAATALHAGMEKLTRNVASLINFLSSHYQILGGEAVAQAQTFAESIVAIVSAIRRGLEEAAGIEGLNATYDGAFVVGQNWITGIVDGITSRLSDLTDLMAYIRGLFPSSPAQYGPWRDLPMGNEVTQRWLAGMSQELRRTSELERSLAGVRGMYSGLVAGAYVGAGGWGLGSGGGGGDVTVNLSMSGPFYIRQDADVEKLATAVGEVLARQAGLTRRMGQQARRT